MASNVDGSERERDLRLRALAQLRGQHVPQDTRLDAAAALGVLLDLASSPSTAAAALTLLHELQVHQVELDLQDEELRRSRTELETTLARQVQLYDFAPVGYVTVDRDTVLREINLTAASLLGFERDQILGRTLDTFLEPHSARTLHATLDRLDSGTAKEVLALRLVPAHAGPPSVHAAVSRDPASRHFLVALMCVAERDERLAR
jgi:PAS domain S-box-containing protein